MPRESDVFERRRFDDHFMAKQLVTVGRPIHRDAIAPDPESEFALYPLARRCAGKNEGGPLELRQCRSELEKIHRSACDIANVDRAAIVEHREDLRQAAERESCSAKVESGNDAELLAVHVPTSGLYLRSKTAFGLR